MSRTRVVVITADALGAKMAGPGIRAWQIARALAPENDVVLATLSTCALEGAGFTVRAVTGRQLRELESWCDVLLFQGFVMASHPWLRDSAKVLVVDVYDPLHLEQLEQARDGGEAHRGRVVRATTVTLNEQLLRADLLLCASDKQRDFWLGALGALGRLNPTTYDDDPTLQRLLTVVPFGLSAEPPVRRRAALKGVVPGIAADDEVVLWGGGIYNWFDPLTLLHAVDRLRARRPRVRLYFLGLKHPNPEAPTMRMALETRALADRLGLTDRVVFFNEGWVDYEARADYLLDADVGVTTHLEHVETAYSFRTRVLDYLWAGLPVVSTTGDTFADLAEREGFGLTVAPGDVDALEQALFRLLDDAALRDDCRERSAAVARRFVWDDVLEPLVRFCREPRRAPDLVAGGVIGLPAEQQVAPPPPPPTSLAGDVWLFAHYLRSGGLAEVGRRAAGRVRRRATESLGRSC
ncbi:MAG: glycosyltransferase family 4 protein [Actinomycetota bacterium]|nr:glycosyltransferase family 4 protein [Actinomycetota bacterium]